MRMIPTIALSLTLILTSFSASAQSGLYHEKEVNNRLLVAAVVDKINRECKSLSVRFFKARAFIRRTEEIARSLGYSDQEIKTYTEDRDNRAEMRKRRDRYFEANGASSLDGESLCVLGRSEIQKNSQIGAVLRAR
ncbi:DUF5333 domain-containing protein [uncultured Roseovarius sp.]|uniref:DUF5333 domain-containing protein n=1 Tax=uncultured Roseovarius sp. TaxID=293344 RepID=UPI0026123949|nr:DUF5333 domain-containing protein [uncultured Roseovarius sp.]